MLRIALLLTALASLLHAAVKVGVFSEEVEHSFTSAQGLPDDRVNCVAAAGSEVYAGTPKGLAVYSQNAWRAVPKFTGGAVDLCATSSAGLLLTYDGGLFRLSDRLAPLPAGQLRSIAAAGQSVLIATSDGLFRFASGSGQFTPVTLPRKLDIRQVAASPAGEIAIAAAEGLFVLEGDQLWRSEYPHDRQKSWAPADVRGVAYNSDATLWFASPQGVGRRDSSGWKLYTGIEGLPYDDFTSVAAGEPGVMWFGTKLGAIRFDGKTWEYRQGRRWLPDDEVRSIAVAAKGDAWFATSHGAALIERKPETLAEKARFFEDEIDRYHRRTEYGYVMAVRLAAAGDKSKSIQQDSDNDGLWTSMYGAGECYAWAAIKDPLARQRARKAFEALRFLSLVTQGGEHPAPPGFPARAILPTSGPDPNLHDSRERDVRNRAERDHLWKVLSPRWPKSADGKWYWKSDTSSDELDGHYYFYALYYDLVAETPQEKEEVRSVVRAITGHIVDHNFTLVDWDGTPARWGHFDPATLNSNKLSWADRGLNSLSILSYLKVAEHITGDAKFKDAYQTLVRDYGYATNAMVPKIAVGPGSGNQSDDEMAFMNYYTLLAYEKEPDLAQRYAYSLANYWGVERLEMNPFFNFVAAASLTGRTFDDAYSTRQLTPVGDWLEDSIDTLRRLPLDRIDWAHKNSHRRDIVHLRRYIEEDDEMEGAGYRRNGKVLPVDERFFNFWNHNPYRLDTGGRGRELADGAVFLLPYYMGLYHRYIEN